jgi:hypothetical protein
MRNRIFGLALIALAVPFPALALEGGGAESSGSPGLTVTASLDSCGLAGSQIMCKIDAGWNSPEGADSYTVSVTSADGSVVDMGETTGQGTSVYVPYVGSGTYSVQVTAWGTPPGEEDDGTPEVIARSSSLRGGELGVAKSPPEDSAGDSRSDDGTAPTVDEPTDIDGAVPGDPRDETPVCEEPPTEEPPVPPVTDPETSPDDGDESAAPAEPEVVDTIPADDDCTG